MYVYERKNAKAKVVTITSLIVVAILITGLVLANYYVNNKEIPVFKPVEEKNVPILNLPSPKQQSELAIVPYKVNAKTALHYFDFNKTSEELAKAVTEFEGVYRPNQGIDYTFENKAFEAIAIFSGVVTDVKDDSMFGKTVVVESDKVKITYQSLASSSLKKNDVVKQGSVIGIVGENIYNKDLGIHLHVVVEKDNMLVDPATIYSKSIVDIK